jgi:hypothetical protein
MAEPNLTVRRSRGFNSLIRGETLDKYMRDAINTELKPFAEKEFEKYVGKWNLKPRLKDKRVAQVGQTRGQVFTMTVQGPKLAIDRWNMVDTEGRKGGKIVESKKTKYVKVASERAIRGESGAGGRVQTKVEVRKVKVPMPLRRYLSKTNHRGSLFTGSGEYEEPPYAFRTKVKQGAVRPAYITRDHIAPVIRREMTRVVENAYRRAFRAITGRGI